MYVVDRPGYGRSPHHPDVLGPLGPQVGEPALRAIFFPPAEGPDSHPSAHLHDQWPGGREPGDPVFDQFQAPLSSMPAAWAEMQALEQARLAELLDRVGPAVLVTHSAGGPGAFLAADARPDQVAALIAIETLGPPFAKRPEMGLDLAWGLASAPLTFDPAGGGSVRAAGRDATPAAQPEPVPDRGRHRRGVDVRAVRRRPGGVPRAAPGVTSSWCGWPTTGSTATRHGIMIERNNAEALDVITRWVAGRLTELSPHSTTGWRRRALRSSVYGRVNLNSPSGGWPSVEKLAGGARRKMISRPA